MTLGVVVLAHRDPEQVAFLLSTLRHPDVRLYLHVDRRVDAGSFARALQARGMNDATLLNRHATPWGGAGVIDAQLEGLRRALNDGCGYVVLVSGQDFPLESPRDLVERFAVAPDRSYVFHFPLPDPRWAYDGRMRTEFYTFDLAGRRETYIPWKEKPSLSLRGRVLNMLLGLRCAFLPPRRFPSHAEPYGGWTWWNLSRSAGRCVLEFVEAHPDYRAYHTHTLSADEIFFHSILLGTGFHQRHEVVNDALRYMEWNGKHPRILTSEDLPVLRACGEPFARKLDAVVDREVLETLAGAIGAPAW